MPDHRYEFDPRNNREQLKPFDPERPRAPRAIDRVSCPAPRRAIGWQRRDESF